MRPWLFLAFSMSVLSQDVRQLTLEQAEQLALRNHPRVGSATLNVGVAEASLQQARAASQPQAIANLTSVGADHNTVIGAGALQTSALSSRIGVGFSVSQLLTDFGRTGQLAASARFRVSAQHQNLALVRAQVLLQVDQAYYAVLGSDALLRVARARLEAQRLTLRQVEALAASSLKSTLDVSFAQVAVSEAELALSQAENSARGNRALLAAAMGESRESQFNLADI